MSKNDIYFLFELTFFTYICWILRIALRNKQLVSNSVQNVQVFFFIKYHSQPFESFRLNCFPFINPNFIPKINNYKRLACNFLWSKILCFFQKKITIWNQASAGDIFVIVAGSLHSQGGSALHLQSLFDSARKAPCNTICYTAESNSWTIRNF